MTTLHALEAPAKTGGIDVLTDPPASAAASAFDVIDYQLLFRSSPGKYLVLTPEFEVADATEAYLEATNRHRDEIVGRSVFDLVLDGSGDPHTAANLRASLELVRRDLVTDSMAVQRYDVHGDVDDGTAVTPRYWSPTNVPIVDRFGRLLFILHRVVDVTDFTLLDWSAPAPELTEGERSRSASLAAEIFRRGVELQDANQRLVAHDLAKSDFLSRMSHELRTPLNSILGFSQLLEREELSDDQVDSVGHITSAGRHLLQLINEVLDISRIEARQMDISLEPVGADAILEHVARMMAPAAAQNAVRIEVVPTRPMFVRADRQRLEQVLLNLLSNAIKYNRPHGGVRLTTEVIDEQRLRIAVADTGIGIDPVNFPSVFEPFARVGAAQHTVEGTGIGLALTKRLVELMGGAIGFTSITGDGSTFWVDLDLTDEPATAPVRPPRSPRPATLGLSGQILYVEDNLANLTLLKRILRREPAVEVLSAMQGRLGLDMARLHQPRLILLDVHLPDMLGHQFIHELKVDPSIAPIPVVVLSADATDRQVARLLDAGATAYLTKPIDIDELERVLGTILATPVPADL